MLLLYAKSENFTKVAFFQKPQIKRIQGSSLPEENDENENRTQKNTRNCAQFLVLASEFYAYNLKFILQVIEMLFVFIINLYRILRLLTGWMPFIYMERTKFY